jgi:DNA-binding response OmpR family regulator
VQPGRVDPQTLAAGDRRAAQKLLVIDDNEFFQGFAKAVLQHAGFAVEIAPDGPTGISLARAGGYDIIVLDLVMPGMDGFAVLRVLRESIDTPILMVSGQARPDSAREAMEAGAQAFLDKPFKLARFLALLDNLCERRP